MSVNFPTDRPGAGLGSGPLQQGDSWRFNSIEYTWVITPDGTGIWSSKGINVNPELYVAKDDDFSGDVSGDYNSGLDVLRASEADVADKVASSLTLTFQPAVGDPTTITYDGSSAQSITFADTDIAQDVITVTGSEGIDVTEGTNISTDSTVARIRTSSPATVNNSNYLYRKNGTSLETVRAYRADRAQYDENGEDLINQTELNNAITAIDVNGSGRIHCDIRNYATDTQTNWDNAFSECMLANNAVYLPSGSYNFGGVVGATAGNRSAVVYGDGSGSTILHFEDGGLSFIGRQLISNNPNLPQPMWDSFHISGLTIKGRGDQAVRIEYTDNGYVTEKAYMSDVAVSGNFDIGFHLINTDVSTFERLSVTYLNGKNVTATNTIGVKLTAKAETLGSGEGDPVNIRFNNCNMSDLGTGFTVDSEAEGVYIIDSLVINTRIGIALDGDIANDARDPAEPFYVVRGCNLDVTETCLILKACMQCVISDNTFYKRTGSAGNWQGIIILDNSFDNLITDNIFNGNIFDPDNDAIVFTGVQLDRCNFSLFSNNHFINVDRAFFSDSTQVSFNEFNDNTYRIVTTRYAGTRLGTTSSLFAGANKVCESFVSNDSTVNEYHIKAGQGLKVFDFNFPDGFTVTSGGGGSSGDLVDILGSSRSIYELVSSSDIANPNFDWSPAINQAGSTGGDWYFPVRNGGYRCNSPITITRDGTKFFGNDSARPTIRFHFVAPANQTANGVTANHRAGLWCAAKTRLRNLKFEFERAFINGNRDAAGGSSSLVLFQKGDTSGSQRDDMDSSVDNCNFSDCRVIQSFPGSACITYYGRNMRVTSTTFSSGGGNGDMRAIALSYAKDADDTNGGQELATGGHRKNMVLNNTFHQTKDAICIELFTGANVDNGSIHGLLINGNINDLGSSLLIVNSGVTANSTCITGNSNIRGNRNPYVHIKSGAAMTNSTISGNSFGSVNTDNNNHRANGVQFDSGSSGNCVTINGNSFGAFRIDGAGVVLNSTCRKIAIVGNTFADLYGQSTTAIVTNTNTSGTIVGNVVDGLTLRSGGGDWEETANNV